MAVALDPKTVRTVAHILWDVSVAEGVAADERKKLWADQRSEYTKQARVLMRRLMKKGLTVDALAAE